MNFRQTVIKGLGPLAPTLRKLKQQLIQPETPHETQPGVPQDQLEKLIDEIAAPWQDSSADEAGHIEGLKTLLCQPADGIRKHKQAVTLGSNAGLH